MAKEEYKQINCPMCGFMVRAETTDEAATYFKQHAAKSHGMKEMKEMPPVQSVMVDVPKKM